MSKPLAIVSDIDGTLAVRTHERPDPYAMELVGLDAPNQPIVDLLKILRYNYSAQVILVTARENIDFHGTNTYDETAKWLNRYGIPWDVMLMRAAKDYRNDAELKREFYVKHIEPYYDVKYVLDDRDSDEAPVVRMWRSLGLTCLAVADGQF